MEKDDQFKHLEQLALTSGFTAVWMLDPATLDFRPDVRAMCAENKCGSYNRNWTCPPACGTVEEAAARAAAYHRGILVQTTGSLEDCFDAESIEAAIARHRDSFGRLLPLLRAEYPGLFPMGAGACTRCKTCTYPDSPCRFPDLAAPSMEAFGLLVSEICRRNGAPCYSGADTVTFVSAILID